MTTPIIRPFVEVIPDDQMRERQRSSLNRLPDITDWEPGNRFTDLLRELRQPVCIHRKAWEYALCLEGLESLNCIKPESAGIAIGAGTEPPLYYFANCIRRMVATDLYENPDHEGKPDMLVAPEKFAPFPYREQNLEVYRMAGDALGFDNGSFDFAFTLSSIEHFGSREVQSKSVSEIMRILKPGGVACIITELLLSPGDHAEYFSIEEMKQMFVDREDSELVGGEFDFTISDSLVRYPVDLARSNHSRKSPHIVLKQGNLLWTSISMFLRKL